MRPSVISSPAAVQPNHGSIWHSLDHATTDGAPDFELGRDQRSTGTGWDSGWAGHNGWSNSVLVEEWFESRAPTPQRDRY
jgi:hypothetical protein